MSEDKPTITPTYDPSVDATLNSIESAVTPEQGEVELSGWVQKELERKGVNPKHLSPHMRERINIAQEDGHLFDDKSALNGLHNSEDHLTDALHLDSGEKLEAEAGAKPAIKHTHDGGANQQPDTLVHVRDINQRSPQEILALTT